MATNSDAVDPHCGVCQHSSCDDDEETPFCSEWDQLTTIRVGTVCSEFSPTAGTGTSITSAERTVDGASESVTAEQLPGDDLQVRGSNGPFYAAYESDGETRYGWFCGNCQSLDVVMDSMGRVVCTHCENDRKPNDWDAAYL